MRFKFRTIRHKLLTALSLSSVLLSLVVAVPAASAAVLPKSCAEVRQQNPSAADGEYTLNLAGHFARIYCANMAGAPTEYLSLVNTGGNNNYSFSPGAHVVYSTRNYVIQGTDANTSYRKVRIDPTTLVVDQKDVTFADLISIGANGHDPQNPNFNPTPRTADYAAAGDCYNMGSARGRANVDLTGTDFAIDDSVNFAVQGFAQNGTVSMDTGRQVVNLTGGGWCGGAGPTGPLKLKLLTPLVPTDTTPPHTTAVAPTGWQNQDVTIALSATDDTGVAATHWSLDGGAPQQGTNVVVSGEGTHSLSFYSVDTAGNQEAPQTVNVQIDKTAPTISGAAAQAANANGWYNGAVTVNFTCADNLSGVANCAQPVNLAADGANQSATGTAADNAGNTASAAVSGINVDTTAATVSYSGNAGTYTVDQQVNITCASADALSGVAADTCKNVSGPAYNYNVGSNTVSATATDKAGNVGTGATTFTVKVTYVSLCNLTQQFLALNPPKGGDKDDRDGRGGKVGKDEFGGKIGGLSNAMCVKLDGLKLLTNVPAPIKAIAVNAYINLVQAQSGKALTQEQAAILIRLAKAL